MNEQKIVIQPLSAELCEDWLQYFDGAAFEDHEEWAFCYCLEGHLTPKEQEEWTDSKERREKAIELIYAGRMRGYLAYSNGEVVGWCNVNDRENYRYLTSMFQSVGYQDKKTEHKKVKVIYCFLIVPKYRGRGIAQALLNRVCEDAARDGYDCVEVYPFADRALEFQYHGTIQMYEQNGFMEAADLKYVKVMRKELK